MELLKRLYSALLIFIVIPLFLGCSEKIQDTEVLSAEKNPDYMVFFYNVENLFDTHNKPSKQDDDFLPNSDKEWTPEKYQKKLADIAKVIASVDSSEFPELVGLAEVENRQVVKNLRNEDTISQANYQIIHEESPDYRGIDVALLYRPDAFKFLNKKAIPVTFPSDPDYKTRDILYVKGIAGKQDTLHIFVNHWPSRIGGVEETAQKRIVAARTLKKQIEEIRENTPKAQILIMGDMNDEPENTSLHNVLGAKNKKKAGEDKLYNLMYEKHLQGKGSYKYQEEWYMYDNLIVSYSLLQSDTGYTCNYDAGHIYNPEWLRYYPGTGEFVPDRTYGGSNYYGGISDHFPVYATLTKAKNE